MLTAKQEAFVSAYCSNGHNATKAAIAAGYSPKGAKVAGHRAYTNVNVNEAIKAFMDSVTDKALCTVNGLLEELEQARTKALNAESPQCSAAVAATLAKAKLTGLDQSGSTDIEAQALNISFKVLEPVKEMIITRGK